MQAHALKQSNFQSQNYQTQLHMWINRYILKREYKKRQNQHKSSVSRRYITVKGRFGVIRASKLKVRKIFNFKKYLMEYIKRNKHMKYLWSSDIGVTGRGMYGNTVYRGTFFSSAKFFQKKGRKYNKRFCEFAKLHTLKKEKSQKTKRKNIKKKKVYTWHVRRQNKWFPARKVLRGWVTHVGERGHVFFIFPFKFALKFKRSNALYKRMAYTSTHYEAQLCARYITYYINMKKFGPYKVKGLKFLYQMGILREGKSRKF